MTLAVLESSHPHRTEAVHRRRRRPAARPDHRTSRRGRPRPGTTLAARPQHPRLLLYQLLSGRGELDTTCGPPLTVQIRGAHIAGPLTLTHLTLRCPLELRDCHLESDVDLTKAIGSDLSLAGSHLHGTLQGRRLRLDHDLDLSLFVCSNRVHLPGARIGGVLDCSGAELTNDTGPALAADGLTVDGSVFLRNGFTATGSGQLGAVRLLGAHIKGPLECTGATLTNETGPALIADGLTVEGVFLAYGFIAIGHGERGTVRLFGARVGGQLACPDARMSNDSGPALYADRLIVGDGMFLAHGFIAVGHGEQGAVRLL